MSAEGEQRYAALVRAAEGTVIGLDFDGTLSPIVDDPGAARIHPDARDVLVDLAEQVAAIAVITGRPARQALDLGGLEEVGNAIGDAGKELLPLRAVRQRALDVDQPADRRTPPAGRAGVVRAGAAPDAAPCRCGRGVRRGQGPGRGRAHPAPARPEAAFERLLPKIKELAGRNDLVVEPGRSVIEVRSPGTHKGLVVERLAEELEIGGFLFAGDDLGDLEAFEAVESLADRGLPTLLVCSASAEESALLDRSDVVVRGPEGVLDLLRRFTADARDSRA